MARILAHRAARGVRLRNGCIVASALAIFVTGAALNIIAIQASRQPSSPVFPDEVAGCLVFAWLCLSLSWAIGAAVIVPVIREPRGAAAAVCLGASCFVVAVLVNARIWIDLEALL